MNFSFSGIFAGLVFGVFGFHFFKRGRVEADFRRMGLGLALMTFPYFVENAWLLWGIGAALLFVAFRD